MRFAPTSSILAVTSWDGHIRFLPPHQSDPTTTPATVTCQSPVLACDWTLHSTLLAATAAGSIICADPSRASTSISTSTLTSTSSSMIVGQHDGPCRALADVPRHDVVASAGADGHFCLWDLRSSARVYSTPLPGKAFAMTLVGDDHLALASVQHSLGVVSVPDLVRGAPITWRTSKAKSQARELRALNSASFVLGAVDGKVSVESLLGAGDFTFKCHRDKGPSALTYAVHALAVHPSLGTFCTGGGDGAVHTWDPTARKRITSLVPYGESIASLDVSPDGQWLAVAASYGWERGEEVEMDEKREEEQEEEEGMGMEGVATLGGLGKARHEVHLQPVDPSQFKPKA